MTSASSTAGLRRHSPRPLLGPCGGEHECDRLVEAVEVLAHAPQELAAARIVELMAAHGLEAEPHRGQGCLHLVRHRVEERALALVQAHLRDQPGAEPDEPDHHHREEDRTEHEPQPVEAGQLGGVGTEIAPDEHLPAHREGEHEDDEHDADGDGDTDRSSGHGAAPWGPVHGPG